MKANTILLGLALLATISVGCSEDSTSPVCGPETAFVYGQTEAIEVDSAVIGAEGGYLEVGPASLLVPPGALSKPLTLTLALKQNGKVELGPDGTHFLTPVTLMFEAPGDPADYGVEWYDPETGLFVSIPSLATADGRQAALAHFSIYKLVSFE